MAEKLYLSRLASLPCGLCGTEPVEVHHLRTGVGMGQRSSHFLAIPLCPECHRGDRGIHGDRTMLRVYKKDELNLLSDTIRKVFTQLTGEL